MPTSSDVNARSLANRVLLAQAVIGLVVTLACWPWGWQTSLSGLAGAVTGVVANLYMTFRAMQPARTARAALGRMYFGQLLKVVLTVVLLVAAVLVLQRVAGRVSVPALIVGYIAVLAVSWVVSFLGLRGTRAPPGQRGQGWDEE